MWNLVFNAALIGAHIQKSETGFRQRDVKFLMELFWNWQSSLAKRNILERIHSNQIKRGLHDLVADIWASRVGKSDPIKYRLTRSGMVEILKTLREYGLTGSFESFLFCRFFFSSYRERIVHFIEKAGSPMPLGFRNEILDLIDSKTLLQERTVRTKKEIVYYQDRIQETQKTIEYCRQQLASKTPLEKIVKSVEKLFPYELNYQKSLSQLLSETPEDLQIWELIEGNQLRSELLWKEQIKLLESQLENMK